MNSKIQFIAKFLEIRRDEYTTLTLFFLHLSFKVETLIKERSNIYLQQIKIQNIYLNFLLKTSKEF